MIDQQDLLEQAKEEENNDALGNAAA